ncbi:uncharacterized protein MONBRDRAFT_32234 [Monosiga brevicollis MX1]|uniref:Sulfotransferase domain-containing protein n=1 Tax=Monosiga brevicollis TaxID=81824 RepID=A9UXL6_MONBE|nr:uncharacterized protein MONBRDRAFT_32234 [Monosiga brevicollis MX1]EDQ90031.1 predicted protein [Monosiga brevicollis MX1]|eukprot:XP_001745453.1 hypothetical protein [Monosiga brevicollis MX1]
MRASADGWVGAVVVGLLLGSLRVQAAEVQTCPAGQRCQYRDVGCGYGVKVQADHTYLDLIPPFCGKECFCRVETIQSEKIVFPTVPRSGNTWSRSILEIITGRASESIFSEGRNKSNPVARRASGFYARACGQTHLCKDVRANKMEDIAIIKTHHPWIRKNRFSVPGIGTMLLMTTRNPLDNYLALMRYSPNKSIGPRAFAMRWNNFFNFWLKENVHRNLPLQVIRFEDLVNRETRINAFWHFIQMSGLDRQLNIDRDRVVQSIDHDLVAVAENNHVGFKSLLEGWKNHKLADVEAALASAGDWLDQFGYTRLYQYWRTCLRDDVDEHGQTCSAGGHQKELEAVELDLFKWREHYTATPTRVHP